MKLSQNHCSTCALPVLYIKQTQLCWWNKARYSGPVAEFRHGPATWLENCLVRRQTQLLTNIQYCVTFPNTVQNGIVDAIVMKPMYSSEISKIKMCDSGVPIWQLNANISIVCDKRRRRKKKIDSALPFPGLLDLRDMSNRKQPEFKTIKGKIISPIFGLL